MPSPRVTVIGSANLDFTVAVERLPRPGETVSEGELLIAHGGKGANQAVAARRLGAEVRLIASLGRDAMGDRIAARLAEDGIPPEGLVRTDRAATGVALIVVDRQGRNQIAVAPGANRALAVAEIASRAEAIGWADVLLLQLETPLPIVRWALENARRLGKTTILNPAPARPLPDDLLALVDLLTPNESEAALLTGVPVRGLEGAETAARALLARGVRTVCVTLGAEGALLVEGARRLHAPAFSVQAVDTTAAGDAFNGALAAALAAGEALEDALELARAAAALACTRRGAQESLPGREEVLSFLNERRRG